MLFFVRTSKKEFFMYKRLLTVTFAIIFLCLTLSLLPIHGEAEVYENVLRLHVIANSDSEEDQALKLSVRDEILKTSKELLAECKTREEAKETVLKNLDKLEESAIRALKKSNEDHTVDIELGEEEYPTKNYESCCFPAGEYLSLKVKIGKAEGQNWWCVLFPPMCLGAASECEAIAEVGLTDTQYAIITETESPKYKIRFKLLEAIEKAVN